MEKNIGGAVCVRCCDEVWLFVAIGGLMYNCSIVV